MTVSLKRFKNTYLPIFHKGEIPIVRLEEETDSEQGEQQFEEQASRKKRVLEWISSLVLTESQRNKAENVIPIIIPLIVTIFSFIYYEATTHMHYDHNLDSDFLSKSLIVTLTLLTILLIGIPLEVAHGKLKMFCFISVIAIHCHILSFNAYIFVYDERVINISLASLHLTNIAMNWKEMEYKVLRIIILLILLGPSHLLMWIYYLFEHGLLNSINFLYSVSSMNGVIFGYYWFYGNKKPIFKYALIIMTLIVIIISLMFRRDYHHISY